MNLQECLFFSSTQTACYDISQSGNSYRLRVQSRQEEYEPVIAMSSGPYYRDAYTVSVTRQGVYEPHRRHVLYTWEACKEYLETRGINVEDGWVPEEEQDTERA